MTKVILLTAQAPLHSFRLTMAGRWATLPARALIDSLQGHCATGLTRGHHHLATSADSFRRSCHPMCIGQRSPTRTVTTCQGRWVATVVSLGQQATAGKTVQSARKRCWMYWTIRRGGRAFDEVSPRDGQGGDHRQVEEEQTNGLAKFRRPINTW